MNSKILWGLVWLQLGCLSAMADPATEARAAIQASYNQEMAATAKLDAMGTMAKFTSDGVMVDSKGHSAVAKDKLPELIEIFAAAKSAHLVTKITGFKLIGADKARVTVTEHMEMKLTHPTTHKPMVMVTDDTAQDDWVKSKQGWRLKKTHNLSETTLVNGKKAP